jgi:hypothetical protein
MPTMSMSASGGKADIPDTPHQCPLMTHSGQCVCARRTKVVASCAPAARQWSASYPRSFAMITVSPAAVSATSNTMIKDAPRATPIRPTKTPIKRQSTIRCGRSRDHSISSISRTYATGFVSVLALNLGSVESRGADESLPAVTRRHYQQSLVPEVQTTGETTPVQQMV